MKCNYPLCGAVALYIPVISVPTIRTVGLIRPTPPLPSDVYKKLGLDEAMAIRQYESDLADYNKRVNDRSPEKKPTILTGKEVCEHHKVNYNIADWVSKSDWEALQEAARAAGYEIQDRVMITIKFMPAGWQPSDDRLEIQR